MSGSLQPNIDSRFGSDTPASQIAADQSLSGRSAIVTGGASGIGTETVRALASAGAEVTIATRSLGAAESLSQKINDELGRDLVDAEPLDLGDLDSVADFAERWGKRPLSLLINNAGIMACPFGRTKDGFEMQFGTNHLGHFLLSVLLVPALKHGIKSRVVSLSSAAHRMSDINFNDPNFRQREYHPYAAYGQSKTANALFAVEFDRRYQGQGIRAFSVMPGVIRTSLGRHMTPALREELGFVQKDDSPSSEIVYKSVEAGAATTVWAATAPELSGYGGLYLENCGVALPLGPESPRGTGVAPFALDRASALRLWHLSEELVGLVLPPSREPRGD